LDSDGSNVVIRWPRVLLFEWQLDSDLERELLGQPVIGDFDQRNNQIKKNRI
jgi:hypothetical protein